MTLLTDHFKRDYKVKAVKALRLKRKTMETAVKGFDKQHKARKRCC
jgi:hypothetical protein